jgi:hypothetical protein
VAEHAAQAQTFVFEFEQCSHAGLALTTDSLQAIDVAFTKQGMLANQLALELNQQGIFIAEQTPKRIAAD